GSVPGNSETLLMRAKTFMSGASGDIGSMRKSTLPIKSYRSVNAPRIRKLFLGPASQLGLSRSSRKARRKGTVMKRMGWVLFLGFTACAGCVRTPGYEFPGVKGQVLDSVTKAPIAGASVSVTPFGGSGLVLSSESDASGRFEVQQT